VRIEKILKSDSLNRRLVEGTWAGNHVYDMAGVLTAIDNAKGLITIATLHRDRKQ
jgi:hypothetical protein